MRLTLRDGKFGNDERMTNKMCREPSRNKPTMFSRDPHLPRRQHNFGTEAVHAVGRVPLLGEAHHTSSLNLNIHLGIILTVAILLPEP